MAERAVHSSVPRQVPVIKRVIIGAAKVALLPCYAAYRLRFFDYPAMNHALSLVPGRLGVGLRRAWYEMTLEACGPGLVVEFLAAFRTPKSRVGANCFIGLGSWVGWAHLGDDVITGNHITILSGRRQHGFDRLDVPMHEQRGRPELVRVGADVWIGSGAVISADVSRGTIVASGAVVTQVFPEFSILGGVPATQIGSRASGRQNPPPV